MGIRIILGLLVLNTTVAQQPKVQDLILKVNPSLTEKEADAITKVIYQAGTVNGIDPRLLAAIAAVESGFRVNAIGKSNGEIGLMQLRPEFHLLYLKSLKARRKSLFEVYTNILTAAQYLKGLKTVFYPMYGDLRWVEFYNMGPNAKPTKFFYTRKVSRFYRDFGGEDEFRQTRVIASDEGRSKRNRSSARNRQEKGSDRQIKLFAKHKSI